MSKLVSTVHLANPETGSVEVLPAGSELPEWAEGLVSDARLAGPLQRLGALGATADEMDALNALWASLTDEERATGRQADADITDDELREQLADMRVIAVESGKSFAEVVNAGLSELEHDRTPAKVDLNKLHKGDLMAFADAHGVDSSGTIPEILTRLHDAGIEG